MISELKLIEISHWRVERST